MKVLLHFYLFVCINCTTRKIDQLNDSNDCKNPQKRQKIDSTPTRDELEDLLMEVTGHQSTQETVQSTASGSMAEQFDQKSKVGDESQRAQAIQNAVDLYTDIMRCSLFCTRELISRLMEEKVSQETLHMIYRPVLTKKILGRLHSQLIKIERRLSILHYSHEIVNESSENEEDILKCNENAESDENEHVLDYSPDDDEKPTKIFKEQSFNEHLKKIFFATPKPLRRLYTLRFELLNAFGLSDTSSLYLDEILPDSNTEADSKIIGNCLVSASSVFPHCFDAFLNNFLLVLESKATKLNQKMEEFNQKVQNKSDTKNTEVYDPSMVTILLDSENLMAHGRNRLEWANPIISEFKRLIQPQMMNGLFWKTTFSNPSEKKYIDMRIELKDLIEKLTKSIRSTVTDTIFTTYLNENAFSSDNQDIFKKCQLKLIKFQLR